VVLAVPILLEQINAWRMADFQFEEILNHLPRPVEPTLSRIY
jgi:hypothetical protein